MKKFINKDVGEFFYEKTEGFEMEPPSLVWDNISSHISGKEKFIFYKSWYTYLSLVILITSAFIYHNYYNSEKADMIVDNVTSNNESQNSNYDLINNDNLNIENNNNNALSEKKEIINSEIITVETQKDNNKIIDKKTSNTIDNKINTTSINLNENNLNTKEKAIVEEKIYNINAFGLKDVVKIIFVNSKNENSIVVDKPVANKFGFYEINITNLISGRYKIMIHTDKEIIEHKIENFN